MDTVINGAVKSRYTALFSRINFSEIKKNKGIYETDCIIFMWPVLYIKRPEKTHIIAPNNAAIFSFVIIFKYMNMKIPDSTKCR